MSSMNYRNIKITILVSRKIPTRAISKAFNLSTERVLGLAKDISGQLLDMSITSTDQVRLFAPEIFQASAMRVDLARRGRDGQARLVQARRGEKWLGTARRGRQGSNRAGTPIYRN